MIPMMNVEMITHQQLNGIDQDKQRIFFRESHISDWIQSYAVYELGVNCAISLRTCDGNNLNTPATVYASENTKMS